MKPTTSGFTLLEIMIGMAILAVGLMATSSAMFTAVNAKDQTKERDLALQAMESTLEDILTNPFIRAQDFAGDYAVSGLEVPTEDATRPQVLNVAIDEVGGDPDVLRITMEAAWDHRGGRQDMTLVFIQTNRGG